jgi:hypothetical protein
LREHKGLTGPSLPLLADCFSNLIRLLNTIHIVGLAYYTDRHTATNWERSEFSSAVRLFTTAIYTALASLNPPNFAFDRPL